MKVVFFNRFFFPDTSATSQIVSDLAFHLAKVGHEVHVVTSRVPGGEEASETVNGVSMHRVASAPSGPHGLVRRAAAYFQYYVGARNAARQLVQRGNIVVLKTDPPLLSSAVGPLAKRAGAKVVVWLQDIFPEVAQEYGIPGTGGPTGGLLRRIRNRSLDSVDCVVVLGERMAQEVANRTGVERHRLRVIHNWADEVEIFPVDHTTNSLRTHWGYQNEFVVGYSGNLGRVHEFDTILAAAARLRTDPGICFLIIGRGPRLPLVISQAAKAGLSNVHFQPHQERAMLAQSLGVSDLHLSVLDPKFEGLVHPSKLYGIMAAGRPTVFVGDPQGQTATILDEAHCGISVNTGDASGLADAILLLRADPDKRKRMGVAARRAFDRQYTKAKGMRNWESLLESLVPP